MSVNLKTWLCVALITLIAGSCLIDATQAKGVSESENTWTSKASMPTAGTGAAVTLNDKIYFISSSSNYAYDPSTDNWTAYTPLPNNRLGSFAVVTYQNKIYVIGGYREWANEVYDPVTDTWVTKARMPTDDSYPKASVYGNQIFVLTHEGHNYCYDINADSWGNKTSIIPPKSFFESVFLDDKIYAFGQFGTYIYDPKSDSWSNGTVMPHSIYYPAVSATVGVMAPKKIYVIGGITDILWGLPVDYTQVYDPSTDSWSLAASMPNVYSNGAAVNFNDLIYLIGGYSERNQIQTVYPFTQQYTPLGYGSLNPEVAILSPLNQVYNQTDMSVIYTVNNVTESSSYSLDGDDKIAVTGNFTLSGLTVGAHTLTIYGKGAFNNLTASNTTCFTIANFDTFAGPSFSQIGLVSVAIIVATVVCAAIYYKRRGCTIKIR